jgi:hypothetical protein
LNVGDRKYRLVLQFQVVVAHLWEKLSRDCLGGLAPPTEDSSPLAR